MVRGMWQDYFTETNAIVFLVDAADPARLPEAKKELLQLLQDPALEKTPIAVFGNKCDLWVH